MEYLRDWFDKKKKAAYDSGWRPHGAKVGDKVRLCMNLGADYEDDFYEDVNGIECIYFAIVKSGSIGVIVELNENRDVTAEFEIEANFSALDGTLSGTHTIDDYRIRMPIDDEIGGHFELVKEKPKPIGKQLSFLDEQ